MGRSVVLILSSRVSSKYFLSHFRQVVADYFFSFSILGRGIVEMFPASGISLFEIFTLVHILSILCLVTI